MINRKSKNFAIFFDWKFFDWKTFDWIFSLDRCCDSSIEFSVFWKCHGSKSVYSPISFDDTEFRFTWQAPRVEVIELTGAEIFEVFTNKGQLWKLLTEKLQYFWNSKSFHNESRLRIKAFRGFECLWILSIPSLEILSFGNTAAVVKFFYPFL